MLVRKILRDRAKGPEAAATLKGASIELHARTTLVLYHRDGTQVAQLEHGRPLVIGRAPPSDIVIPDPGLSRQHAQFTWQDYSVTVEDLHSTNGTKRNGKRIDKGRVVPGDEIVIGPVVVSLHVLSAIDSELRGFEGHDRFVAALGEEIMRARTFQRPLALLMVKSGGAKDAHLNKWAHRVRARLRPVDRVGLYGPAAVLILVPEPTPELVRLLQVELTGGTPALTCHTVMFPGDGGTADELIAAVQQPRRADGRAPEPAASPVIAKNAAMIDVMATVKRVAASAIAVLVHGETGTGKEVIATAIHDQGPRRKKPMRTINCAAIPHTLIESVLFGHEQGAFTGADKQARGIFEQADGGTVFLDEIGELSAAAQAALLRVLETKRLTRVGGHGEIEVDVRVIAATHRDLEAMVAAGTFRQDLLYRLNTLTIHIPPLRERGDEICALAERFLKDAAKTTRTHARSIDAEAIAALEAYPWPGNIRELRNVIDRAAVLAEGSTIVLADLTERLRGVGGRPARPTDPPALPAAGNYRDAVRQFETDLILRALDEHGGNQTAAAKALGLPLRTLVHKIGIYGIKRRFER